MILILRENDRERRFKTVKTVKGLQASFHAENVAEEQALHRLQEASGGNTFNKYRELHILLAEEDK